MKQRLDRALAELSLVNSRSQAESYIKLGLVKVNGQIIDQPSHMVSDIDELSVIASTQYVSRAGLKLESVADKFKLDFEGKAVLDVGSSTGGFTDYALKHGAKKVIAVEVGVAQLHKTLLGNDKIELHEKTDIRDVNQLSEEVDIVLIDVSFISLREIIPSVIGLVSDSSKIVAMFKPQFEAAALFRHKGVIKNDRIRRQLLADFEVWLKDNGLIILDKSDSSIQGAKGNSERFYLLKRA